MHIIHTHTHTHACGHCSTLLIRGHTHCKILCKYCIFGVPYTFWPHTHRMQNVWTPIQQVMAHWWLPRHSTLDLLANSATVISAVARHTLHCKCKFSQWRAESGWRNKHVNNRILTSPYLEEESVNLPDWPEIAYLAELISDNFQSVDKWQRTRSQTWNLEQSNLHSLTVSVYHNLLIGTRLRNWRKKMYADTEYEWNKWWLPWFQLHLFTKSCSRR